MRASGTRRSALGATVAILAACTALAATALAAKPKHGARFTGHTSAAAILGFRAPVTFTVSQDGASLKGFTYGSFGCVGAGGFRPGVSPYKGNALVHVGSIKVSSSGRFSVHGVKTTTIFPSQTTVTTIAVSGHFSKAKAATGSITFAQQTSGTFSTHSFSTACGPSTIGFTASGH